MASAALIPFAPPWWLRNRHLQSILPSLAPRRRTVLRQSAVLRAASTPLLLDCGDGVRLQAFYAAPARPDGRLAVLLHGWEGSADAAYLLSLAQDLLDDGCEVIRLNLRDHGDTHHLNRGLFIPVCCLKWPVRCRPVCSAIRAVPCGWPAFHWAVISCCA